MTTRGSRLTLILAAMVALLAGGGALLRSEESDPEVRKGRPRPQVTYKGSSPYFKVDFDRYTGAVTCVWCHPKAMKIWEKEEAFHRDAYDLLGADARKNPECVRCHVTAFNRDGKYAMDPDEGKAESRKLGFTWGGDVAVNAQFLGVQCESCHGPNCGNKYSREDLEAVCVRCHNEESPTFDGFDVEKAFARMKHAAVGADEKVKFDMFAGVDSCFMCHWPNNGTWREHQAAHVGAFESLPEESRKDQACLKCHTTGFSQDGKYPHEEKGALLRGGYVFGGPAATNAKFEGVQCEACHGINCGTITTEVRIRKRCETCHSGACENDDGFDWEKDYALIKHRPPPDYKASEKDRKVLIEWYDLEKGLEVAKGFRMPLLIVFSNPPDG
jgi:Cytochrome c554 and c-prime